MTSEQLLRQLEPTIVCRDLAHPGEEKGVLKGVTKQDHKGQWIMSISGNEKKLLLIFFKRLVTGALLKSLLFFSNVCY